MNDIFLPPIVEVRTKNKVLEAQRQPLIILFCLSLLRDHFTRPGVET